MPSIEAPPAELQNLFKGDTPLSRRFLSNTRPFNNAFAFASFGTSTKYREMRNPPGRGPTTFQVKGQLYHMMGGLLPPSGKQPQFAQLYFHDSDQATEVEHRLDFIYGTRNQATQTDRNSVLARNKDKDKEIITILQDLMYQHNPYAKKFKTVGQRIRSDNSPVLGLKIVCQQSGDTRRYNRPTADEVAAILPGDTINAPGNRDIIIQLRDNSLHRISALHPAYFPLTYPLLFVRGEDGYCLGLTRREPQPAKHLLQHVLNPLLPANTTGIDLDNNDNDFDYDLEEHIDQGHDHSHLNNTNPQTAVDTNLNLADPQAAMDLDHEDEYEGEDDEDEAQALGINRCRTKRITMMDYFAYRLQLRMGDSSEFMFRSRRLLQQLMVDMFCCMDMNRINYLKLNQQSLRMELYSGISWSQFERLDVI